MRNDWNKGNVIHQKPGMKKMLFCCIVLLLAFGCRKSNNNNIGTQNATDIFPNKVGDTWTYSVNDTSFSYQNPVTAVQYNMTISVIDSVHLSGGIRANVWVYNYPGGTDTNYVFQHGDTISLAANTVSYIDIVRQYIIPLRLHNSWQYTANSIHAITVDSQSNIIVGRNHFDNAFHIFGYAGRPDNSFNIDEWLEDHVGVVKRHFNSFHFTTNAYQHITTWSLVSYHLE
jgi:hypothetical protein